MALAIALNPLNLQVRIWLRDEVVKGVPFWLDHLLFMVTLMVVVWGLIGILILGPRGLALGLPERPKEAWLAGLVSGLGLTALVMAALAVLGALVFEPHPNCLSTPRRSTSTPRPRRSRSARRPRMLTSWRRRSARITRPA